MLYESPTITTWTGSHRVVAGVPVVGALVVAGVVVTVMVVAVGDVATSA
ncbi:MAG: hypothetical protein ACO225_05405 [Ilumatobacteraceae bacterium]